MKPQANNISKLMSSVKSAGGTINTIRKTIQNDILPTATGIMMAKQQKQSSSPFKRVKK